MRVDGMVREDCGVGGDGGVRGMKVLEGMTC